MSNPATRGTATATSAVSTVFVANRGWTFGLLHNVSDTTVYFSFTNEPDELTAANGMPLLAGEKVRLQFPLGRRTVAPLKLILASAGSKEIRWAVA